MADCRRSMTNQALPQDEQGVDTATTTTMSVEDLVLVLPKAVPCLVFAGSVVLAIVRAIQGEPAWWSIPLTGGLYATVSMTVTYIVLFLGLSLRWLLCYGGICRLGRAAVNAIRSATCRRPQKPSSDDMIAACVSVGMCGFWNGIVWSVVFSACFTPNEYGGGYSWDPGVPVILLLFFLPFMLVGVSLLFYVIFAGPLYHLSYYLLCCCWFETGTAPVISPLDMTKLEKDDDETVATSRTYDESSSLPDSIV